MSHLRATFAYVKKLAEKGMIKGNTASFDKAVFPLSKYYKYGLLSDDLMKEGDVIKEALRRLPKDVYQERQYRLTRAINYSANKSVLPESDWTTPEQDVSYLRPSITQVVNEIREKEDWNSGKLN